MKSGGQQLTSGMTVRQIIQEIEALSPEDRKEVGAFLFSENRPASVAASSDGVRYLDREAAKPLIKEILTEHSELFQKLAK